MKNKTQECATTPLIVAKETQSIKQRPHQPYKEFWEEIKKASKITLVTHVMPDGDTVGSAIALKEMIVANTNKKHDDIKISGVAAPRFLEQVSENEIVAQTFFDDSLTVVVDANDATRTADARVWSEKSIKIDHHPITPGQWKVQIGGDYWIATGQLLFEMAQILNLKLTPKAKNMIFTAIWTDSDGMTALHKMPESLIKIVDALDVDKEELISNLALLPNEQKEIDKLEKFVKLDKNVGYLILDQPLSNNIGRQLVAQFGNKFATKVFCTISPTYNDPNLFLIQFRSRGDFDVQKLAVAFGGNGHYFASGCGIKGDLAIAKKTMNAIIKYVDEHIK